MDPRSVPILLIGVAIAAVFVVVFAFQSRRWRRRRSAWERVALQLGLQPSPAPELPAEATTLELFQRGRRQKLRGGAEGATWAGRALLADHEYTTGGGQSTHVHRQTVCIFQDPSLELPHFVLRPERAVIDRIVELFGAKDLDFEDDPTFSRAYVLNGEDEAAVRTVFTPSVRSLLVQLVEERLHLEGRGDTLLLHRGRLVDPERAGEILQILLQLVPLLRR